MWSLFKRETVKEFPYEIIETYPQFDGICKFCKGYRKAEQHCKVSIFSYEKSDILCSRYKAMQNYLKRLKTLRHPGIVTYLDSFENDDHLYIVTEPVEPLQYVLDELKDSEVRKLYIPWGILNIVRAVSFLNDDAGLRHNGICLAAVFVTEAGEWKLAELGFVTEKEDKFPIKDLTLKKYDPPDVSERQVGVAQGYSADLWGLGVLVWEIYNGPMESAKSLRSVRKIPSNLRGIYTEMVAANPSYRPTPSAIIKRCSEPEGYFSNIFIKTISFLEEIHLKTKEEVNIFFKDIITVLENIPDNVLHFKILPLIKMAYECGNEGVFLIPALLKVSENLDEAEYQKTVVPFILKLIGSNDRASRSLLLRNIEHFIDKFPATVINEGLFPLLINGFIDVNVRIREETVKSMVHIIPKLNRKNVDEEVLKHLARLQTKDEQGSVRTNCTVCLGKVAYCLNPSNRSAILTSAFIRALSDPYPPVRNAGVLALASCEQYFRLEDISKKILPSLCHLTLDSVLFVRESTFKTIYAFLNKLKSVSDDPSLKEEMEKAALSVMPNPVSSWADWAVSALTKLTVRPFEAKDNTQDEAPQSSSGSDIEKKPSDDKIVSSDTTDTESDVPTSKSDDFVDWDDDNWLRLSDCEQTPE